MDLHEAVRQYTERVKAAPNGRWCIVDTYSPSNPFVVGSDGGLVYRDDTTRRYWVSSAETSMSVWDVRQI